MFAVVLVWKDEKEKKKLNQEGRGVGVCGAGGGATVGNCSG